MCLKRCDIPECHGSGSVPDTIRCLGEIPTETAFQAGRASLHENRLQLLGTRRRGPPRPRPRVSAEQWRLCSGKRSILVPGRFFHQVSCFLLYFCRTSPGSRLPPASRTLIASHVFESPCAFFGGLLRFIQSGVASAARPTPMRPWGRYCCKGKVQTRIKSLVREKGTSSVAVNLGHDGAVRSNTVTVYAESSHALLADA